MVVKGEEWKITGHATTCAQHCCNSNSVLGGCTVYDSIQDIQSYWNVSCGCELRM